MLTLFRWSQEEGLRVSVDMSEVSRDGEENVWLDLEAPTPDEMAVLRDVYRFHPLAIENVKPTIHRPKVDDFVDYIFLTLHAVNFDAPRDEFSTLELDVFFGKRFVVTVHHQKIKCINEIRERCRRDEQFLCRGLDRLLHDLLDALVDNYNPTLEKLDLKIDKVENEVFKRPSRETLNRIFSLKRDVLHLRRIVAPQMEVLNRLSRGEFDLIPKGSLIYLRDVYDHLVRIVDLAEAYRDLIGGVLDIYLSVVSNRMNEVMKTLTIIATIMMPLTLIVGIYGMNFTFMPELSWRYSYFVVLGSMASIVAGMMAWFKRRGWF